MDGVNHVNGRSLQELLKNADSLQAARDVELLRLKPNIIKPIAKHAELALKLLLKTTLNIRAGSNRAGSARAEPHKPEKSSSENREPW